MGFDPTSITPLRTMSKTVDGALYNRVRLALLRLGNPLCLEEPRLRLEFALEKKLWLARSVVTGMPMLVWTEFEAGPDRALHQPLACRLHLYHVHAGLVMGTALESLDALLKQSLANARLRSTGE